MELLEADPVTFDNMFEKQLGRLSVEQAWVLQVLGQHRSALLTTLVDTLERARAGFVAECLEQLRELGLAECQEGIWRLTWSGTGVANWREQKAWADMLPAGMSLPEPRDGENGLEVGPPAASSGRPYSLPVAVGVAAPGVSTWLPHGTSWGVSRVK